MGTRGLSLRSDSLHCFFHILIFGPCWCCFFVTGEIWKPDTIEAVTMALMRFLHIADPGIVEFHCFDMQMGHHGCSLLVPLVVDVHHFNDHNGFLSFLVGCACDLALTYGIISQAESICQLWMICTIDVFIICWWLTVPIDLMAWPFADLGFQLTI